MKNNNKMILTIGLPASGKSSWANEHIKVNDDYVIINRDDIRRDMLDGVAGYGDPKTENKITKIEEQLVLGASHDNKNIIITDTNLRPKDRNKWRRFCSFIKYEYSIKDFTHVPLSVCIERDASRDNNAKTDSLIVGEKVITRMYNQNLKNNPDNPFVVKKYDKDAPENINLPKAIIVDIDGTVAHMDGQRRAFEWKKAGVDNVDVTIRDVITTLHNGGYQIIFMSGRDSVCRKETIEWLHDKDLNIYAELFMRREKDNRPDDVIKHELFWDCVVPKYRVMMSFDDRNRVVETWREMGIKCLQVEHGDF